MDSRDLAVPACGQMMNVFVCVVVCLCVCVCVEAVGVCVSARSVHNRKLRTLDNMKDLSGSLVILKVLEKTLGPGSTHEKF